MQELELGLELGLELELELVTGEAGTGCLASKTDRAAPGPELELELEQGPWLRSVEELVLPLEQGQEM